MLARNVRAVLTTSRPAWSHDDRRLAYTSGALFESRNLWLVDVADGRSRQVTQFEKSGEGPQSQEWLPDDRHLVVSYVASPRVLGTSDVGVLDIETGVMSRLTANVVESFDAPTISADGSRMMLTSSRSVREVWKVPVGPDPVANGQSAVRLLDASLDPMWTYVTRDGRTLLFSNALVGSRNLWTISVDGTGTPRQITTVSGDAVMHSSLSPDGRQVVFASNTAGNADIWVQNVDGSQLRQLTNDPAADAWPVWSPDGRSIMFALTSGRRLADQTDPRVGRLGREICRRILPGRLDRATRPLWNAGGHVNDARIAPAGRRARKRAVAGHQAGKRDADVQPRREIGEHLVSGESRSGRDLGVRRGPRHRAGRRPLSSPVSRDVSGELDRRRSGIPRQSSRGGVACRPLRSVLETARNRPMTGRASCPPI